MIPAEFEYFAPTSAAEAVQLLSTHAGNAKLLAGGHSLLPAMRLRLSQPAVVIDIGRIRDLAYVRADGSSLAIGAMTTHHTIETDRAVHQWAPVLAAAAAEIGDPQVRNRGTIGGAVAHADPAADYPAVLLALDAEFRIAGPGGDQVVRSADFFRGPYTTAVGPDNLLLEVRLPGSARGSGSAYRKLAKKGSHYAVVGAAVYLEVSGNRCQAARVALNGASGAAFRAAGVEQALMGVNLEREDEVAAAAARVADGVELMSESGCSAEFRAHLAQVYTQRAIEAAFDQARRG